MPIVLEQRRWSLLTLKFFCQSRLDAIDLQKAVDYVLSCMNFDGGFGCRPGSESHSGQVCYCQVDN